MQIKAYKQILETEAVYNMIHKDEKCDCGSKETFVRLICNCSFGSYTNLNAQTKELLSYIRER